jgi:hypothetical protein
MTTITKSSLRDPQDVGGGFVLKHDLPRIDALLAT